MPMEKLSKNIVWMAAANIVSSLFNAAILIYLARTLMPAALGHLSYVMSLIAYLSSFVDMGLSTYGIREIAKRNMEASEYVSNIVSFRCIMAVVISSIFMIVVFLSRQPYLIKLLMAETCLMLFVSALVTEWAFQGMEKMRMVFISFLITSLLQGALIFILVKGPEDLPRVPIAYFAGALPIIAMFLKRLNFKFRIIKLDFDKIKLYLTSSLVIWAISVFAQVYNNLDIFMLGLFKGAEEVGYFTIARRAVSGVTILIIFLANALLPRLSCTFNCDDTEEFGRATRKFLAVAVALIVFMLLPAAVFSKDLIKLTVGEGYLPAALPLEIMIGALVLVLFNLPYSTGLIAACHEKEVLRQVMASALLNVALNIFLIPRYGMVGTALSFFFAEALALVWILHVYRVRINVR